MAKTALRNSDGNPVFVDDTGDYIENFPSSQIVRKADENEKSKFIVHGFVGEKQDFEKRSLSFNNEYAALGFATMMYGRDDMEVFNREGEVYKVEVYEINS